MALPCSPLVNMYIHFAWCNSSISFLKGLTMHLLTSLRTTVSLLKPLLIHILHSSKSFLHTPKNSLNGMFSPNPIICPEYLVSFLDTFLFALGVGHSVVEEPWFLQAERKEYQTDIYPRSFPFCKYALWTWNCKSSFDSLRYVVMHLSIKFMTATLSPSSWYWGDPCNQSEQCQCERVRKNVGWPMPNGGKNFLLLFLPKSWRSTIRFENFKSAIMSF